MTGCSHDGCQPPVAQKIKKEIITHGHKRIDNYYWLRDRENPEVIKYLESENNYLNEQLKDTESLQDKLFHEIIGRVKQDDQSVPYKKRGYYYYVRYEEGKEYPIYCRKKGSLEAREEVLLNVNELAEGYSYFKVSGVYISPSTNLMAYGVDTVSRRIYKIFFKNLDTGEILDNTIENTTGSVTWTNDSKEVFYTLKDKETLRAYKIFKHTLSRPVKNDREIFHEKDETYSTGIFKTKSEEYFMIVSYASLSTEFRYLPTGNQDGEFKVFQPREKNHEYSVDHYGDMFYVHTNWNARNFRLMKTPLQNTTKENWQEIIPHRENIFLGDMELFKDYLAIIEREEGLNKIRVINWETSEEHYLDFGEEVYDAGFSTNPEFDTEFLRYSYTSLTTPSSVYDYNMKTKRKILLKQQEVMGEFSSSNYEAKRLNATANDGEQIPISLVYKKGIELDGNNPLLLYGYGSYGITIDPYFSSSRLSLLDRGFVFAIAHVRGGQIKGRKWYEDGKFLKKKNTFTDFINCAEYLIEEKYTNPGQLFAYGGSAGGLLIGAVINMRPDLFKGVLAAVPFVDVVNTMLDESIPLTTGEYDEWGNPKDKEYYDYMLTYSPYDNVKPMDYPNILVTTGLHDSQVQYWEPAKWVAKLRDLKTDDNLLLLYTNMETGHGGASGRFKQHRETAMEYAFLLKLCKIND
ncbi:MAG: S9 family peptidase [Bacteroidota bacterium]